MTFLKKFAYSLTMLILLCSLVSCKANKTILPIKSEYAPAAIGPYSQAIKAKNILFCSGQIGMSPITGQLVGNDIGTQTRQTLENLKFILEEAGSDFSQVTKVTIFMTDLKNYNVVNEIYSSYFDSSKPARSTVQVEALPKGALIEIECIALIK